MGGSVAGAGGGAVGLTLTGIDDEEAGMGLFGKSDPAGVRAVALVIAAEAPPQGAPTFGWDSQSTVQVLVDRRQLTGKFRYSDKHWLVRGMEIPVFIDPARPDAFDVDWDAIPSMEERAAANDPALADPVGAAQRVAQALGIPVADLRGTRPDQLQASLAKAAAGFAPPGRLRAVVLISTVRGRLAPGGSDSGTNGTGVTLHRGSEAVLSVHVPGRAPYAVFVPRFKVPHGHGPIPGGLPALVSATDARDIEIRWDESPTLAEHVATRIAESTQQSNAQFADLRQQFLAATQQATAAYQPGAAPAGAQEAGAAQPGVTPSGMPQPGMPQPGMVPAGMMGPGMVPPQVREMVVNNLRASLRHVTNPAQRQMILDQYRATGLDITAEELGFPNG